VELEAQELIYTHIMTRLSSSRHNGWPYYPPVGWMDTCIAGHPQCSDVGVVNPQRRRLWTSCTLHQHLGHQSASLPQTPTALVEQVFFPRPVKPTPLAPNEGPKPCRYLTTRPLLFHFFFSVCPPLHNCTPFQCISSALSAVLHQLTSREGSSIQSRSSIHTRAPSWQVPIPLSVAPRGDGQAWQDGGWGGETCSNVRSGCPLSFSRPLPKVEGRGSGRDCCIKLI